MHVHLGNSCLSEYAQPVKLFLVDLVLPAIAGLSCRYVLRSVAMRAMNHLMPGWFVWLTVSNLLNCIMSVTAGGFPSSTLAWTISTQLTMLDQSNSFLWS
jgi:hypothetical protein